MVGWTHTVTPMTATSATAGCSRRSASSSAGATWLPLTLINSCSEYSSASDIIPAFLFVTLPDITAYLHSVDDMELPLVIHIGNISSTKPPILGLGLLRCLGIMPVPLHDILCAHPQLASLIALQDLSDSIVGHDFGLAIGVEFADRCRETLLSWVPAQNGTCCSIWQLVSLCLILSTPHIPSI